MALIIEITNTGRGKILLGQLFAKAFEAGTHQNLKFPEGLEGMNLIRVSPMIDKIMYYVCLMTAF